MIGAFSILKQTMALPEKIAKLGYQEVNLTKLTKKTKLRSELQDEGNKFELYLKTFKVEEGLVDDGTV